MKILSWLLGRLALVRIPAVIPCQATYFLIYVLLYLHDIMNIFFQFFLIFFTINVLDYYFLLVVLICQLYNIWQVSFKLEFYCLNEKCVKGFPTFPTVTTYTVTKEVFVEATVLYFFNFNLLDNYVLCIIIFIDNTCYYTRNYLMFYQLTYMIVH